MKSIWDNLSQGCRKLQPWAGISNAFGVISLRFKLHQYLLVDSGLTPELRHFGADSPVNGFFVRLHGRAGYPLIRGNNIVTANLPKEMQSHHYPILYQVEETHWWYVGRRRIIRCLVEKIFPTLNNTNPRILDVGCGTGANLKMLADYGRAEGVDISPQAVEFCRERGLDSVRLGAIEHLPYESDSFELVTALDVVEHLDDDVAGLREMRRVLRRDGRLLLFVPAFMFLWGVQDEVSNHRRRYTLRRLLRAVEEAGFSVEWASYANISFFLPVLLVRSVMRWLSLRADTEYGINISLMNGPFSQLFAAERFVLKRGRLPFGVSAVCIARRVEEPD